MNDLNYFGQYEHYLQGRYATMRMALNIFHQFNMQMIVETGCMRGFQDWGGGMSTYLFAEYATKYDKFFHSVDISPKSIGVAKYATHGLSAHIHQGDSVGFLNGWDKGKIDLIYLDSMDMSDDPELAKKSANHQLAEIEAVWGKLNDIALILLDDTNFLGAGKAKLTKHFLQSNSCIELYDYQQSLWLKGF